MLMRILWIEDEYFHIRGLFRLLEDMDYAIVPARSVVEAKEHLKKWGSFNLIVLDLILPHSDNIYDVAVKPSITSKVFGNSDRDLAQNGINLFYYMIDDLGVDLPIIILSVVRTKKIVEKLMEKGAAITVEKAGLLPSDIKDIVLRVLNINNEDRQMDDHEDYTW